MRVLFMLVLTVLAALAVLGAYVTPHQSGRVVGYVVAGVLVVIALILAADRRS